MRIPVGATDRCQQAMASEVLRPKNSRVPERMLGENLRTGCRD